MHPIVEELEKEYSGKITVKRYDVDDPANQALVQQYQVMAMPTFFIEKDGQVVGQFVGAQSKATLAEAINKALS
jgi:thioredoxin 1